MLHRDELASQKCDSIENLAAVLAKGVNLRGFLPHHSIKSQSEYHNFVCLLSARTSV